MYYVTKKTIGSTLLYTRCWTPLFGNAFWKCLGGVGWHFNGVSLGYCDIKILDQKSIRMFVRKMNIPHMRRLMSSLAGEMEKNAARSKVVPKTNFIFHGNTLPKKTLTRSQLPKSASKADILGRVFDALPRMSAPILVSGKASEKAIFNEMNIAYSEIKYDAEGMIPSSLNEVMITQFGSMKSPMMAFHATETERPSFVYAATSSMSPQRSEELYKMCEMHNLMLIESTTCNSSVLRKLDAGIGRVLKTYNSEELNAGLQTGLISESCQKRSWQLNREEIHARNQPNMFAHMYGFP